MAALAPPWCLCQPLFPRAADRRWYCVEISLSGRPGRPARAAHAPGERRSPSRQSSLRKPNTGRKGTASRELKPVSASRAQSFYAPGSIHLGSLPLRHLHRLQVDQWAELGPLLLDRDQQFVEAHVVHLAADIACKVDRR
jgi:hypothetical protein